MNNIVLIGFMGSGKTNVGRRLAEKLDALWLDLDDMVVKEAGCGIQELLEKEGEDGIRSRERQALEALMDRREMVISTGGGVVELPENVRLLHLLGTIVFLQMEPEQILENIEQEEDRTSFLGEDLAAKVNELLEVRTPLYVGCADVIIQTKDKKVEAIVEELIGLL
ncbi:shikimate kinase [Anaerotalea alkaliphila]|uniref:Shikimate kinase n=1 Tax=Anaerotalea alkaliphila TaxID=2662126 RepID=A0A7X5HTG9_9FIRM|nr:shikimate kinase [Anaerotalea alkaliphila]NDL66250.1 shikimate kinase [Anaerotalea alkaliphila]